MRSFARPFAFGFARAGHLAPFGLLLKAARATDEPLTPLDQALDHVFSTLSNEELWSLALALFPRFPPELTPYQVVLAHAAAEARTSGRIALDAALASAWFCAFGCAAYLEGGADALDDVARALAVHVGDQAVTEMVLGRGAELVSER